MDGLILERYSRQMLLPNCGIHGQKKLLTSKVLVVGAGGIGSTVCMYLAAAGISVSVVDSDVVETSNLHRQIIHRESHVEMNKAVSAVCRMTELNPTVVYESIPEKFSHQNALQLVSRHDLVIDATDNFEARYIINDACLLSNIPFISGASVGLEGQIRLIIPYSSPCYRCLHPKPSLNESCRSCSNAGVLGPVAGMVGCLQAIEAIKFLQTDLTVSDASSSNKANHWTLLEKKQTFYDGSTGSFYNFNLPERNPQCRICSKNPSIRSMEDSHKILSLDLDTIQSAASHFKVDLPTENCMTTIQFSEWMNRNNNSQMNRPQRYVLLDVRNAIQFEMSSFRGYWKDLVTFHSLSDCVQQQCATSSSSSNYLIHIPLEVLRGGKVDKLRENKQQETMQQLQSLLYILQDNSGREALENSSSSNSSDSNAISVALFVICRRGIDSTAAVDILLSHGFGPHVFNIEGGYTAWKESVDKTFPMY